MRHNAVSASAWSVILHPLAVRRDQHDIAIDKHVEKITGRHFKGLWDFQLPLRELDARVADLLSEGAGNRLPNAWRCVEARDAVADSTGPPRRSC